MQSPCNMGRLTNQFFPKNQTSGGKGFCPVALLQPLKNMDFSPLLVSEICHNLHMYCAIILFFLEIYVRNCFGNVQLIICCWLKLLSSLVGNLKQAHPRRAGRLKD